MHRSNRLLRRESIALNSQKRQICPRRRIALVLFHPDFQGTRKGPYRRLWSFTRSAPSLTGVSRRSRAWTIARPYRRWRLSLRPENSRGAPAAPLATEYEGCHWLRKCSASGNPSYGLSAWRHRKRVQRVPKITGPAPDRRAVPDPDRARGPASGSTTDTPAPPPADRPAWRCPRRRAHEPRVP